MNNRANHLLKKIQASDKVEGKGHLKIFFGYAAGIGKTYAMLRFAHTAKDEGVDVVVGYIEPHDRPDTIAMLSGLEIIAPKVIEEAGKSWNELNVDEVIARNPDVVLVDELAHSNAAGSRHSKRYQDIQEVLNAGIDVVTTVNVQHLESLHDVVASLTGVSVRERIPDSVFDSAFRIEMIDIPCEELIARLKSGKIYRSEHVERALNNFFTMENLIALREIALRRLADWVNDDGEKYLDFKGEGASSEHILMCLSSSPSNEKVIRQASRLASAFHGKFSAFYVESLSDDKSNEDIDRLRKHQQLAESLNAQVVFSTGDNIEEQIAEYAKMAKVTKLVLGRTVTRKGLFYLKDSFADKISKIAPSLEIFIIPDNAMDSIKKPNAMIEKHWHNDDVPHELFQLFIVMFLVTVITIGLHDIGFNVTNLIMVYLVGVLVISTLSRHRWTSLLYSMLSIFVFNYFFIEPIGTLSYYDPSYVVTFGMMFVTAFITSTLTIKVKSVGKESALKAHRTEILLKTSQLLQMAKNSEEIGRVTVSQLKELLNRNILVFIGYPDSENTPIVACKEGHEYSLPKEELAVAQWTFKNNKHSGFSTTTLPGSRCLFMTVRSGEKVFAVIGIDMEKTKIPSFEHNILRAILNESALAFERDDVSNREQEVAMALSKEMLRANLLRSISHDLRTPLTSISGNAMVLMQPNLPLSEDQKQAFIEDIYDESMWLIRLVENLLSITRFENGTINLHVVPELVHDVIEESVNHVSLQVNKRTIVIEQSDEFIVAKMDGKLIVQVLVNIINNAIKFSDVGSTITIRVNRVLDKVKIDILDEGIGIDDEMKKNLFSMFQKGSEELSDGKRGMGIGLALCKAIVDGHGGTIEVCDNTPVGSIFTVTLKAEVNQCEIW